MGITDETHKKTDPALNLKELPAIGALEIADDDFRRKTALLEALVHSSNYGILVVDSRGQKVVQNKRTIELWKIPQHVVDDPSGLKQVQHVMYLSLIHI